MSEDTNNFPLHQPGSVLDPLTEIAREGARRMLMAALKAEADAFVAGFAADLLPDGRRRVVRHGVGPAREIQTGIGRLPVQRPKVRDCADAPPEAKIRISSKILPKWARRSKSLDALLPSPYLSGPSTGDVQEALATILGAEAPNLQPGVMPRLPAGVAGQPCGPDRLTATQRRNLMEIAEDRYQTALIAITSQLPVEAWRDVIGEPTLADAILSRIMHNAHRLAPMGRKTTRSGPPRSPGRGAR